MQLPYPIQRRIEYFEAVTSNLVATAQAHPSQPAVGQLLLEAAGALEESVRLIRLANWQAKLNQETIIAGASSR